MKLQVHGDTLRISEIKELGADNSDALRDRARAALSDAQRNIEIDLSHTTFVDSCGLGSLIALHKTVCHRQGVVRLLNPQPPVQQILELTRLHRVFEVVNTPLHG